MLSDIFRAALVFTFQQEGGWSNDPDDNGGATHYGITKRTLEGYGKEGDFDHDGEVDEHDLLIMTREDAAKIYQDLYWVWDKLGSINLSHVPAEVMMKQFDIAVNCGVKASKLLLQRAINMVRGDHITVDGAIGPATINAIGGCHKAALLQALCTVQLDRYEGIVAKDETQAKFLKGWTRRASLIPVME